MTMLEKNNISAVWRHYNGLSRQKMTTWPCLISQRLHSVIMVAEAYLFLHLFSLVSVRMQKKRRDP